MLLSTMEITQICYEQNRAYYKAISARDDQPPWASVDFPTRLELEEKVIQVMEGRTEDVLPQTTNVGRITESLFKQMVEVLMEIM